MNYRHAFHIGNFADILKHLVLTLCIEHLKKKDKPFRYIDTHAGIGRYSLLGDEASRSPEWEDGIGRLWRADIPADVAEVLAPFLEVLKELNPSNALEVYPGSPDLAAQCMREQDALRLTELHPIDNERLRAHFRKDERVKIEMRDGYEALKAYMPPPERRGVVLVDPPFEHRDELAHMAKAAMDGISRWPTGTFIFWRPLKDIENTEKFDDGLAEWLIDDKEFDAEKVMLVDMWVKEIVEPGPLCGAGVVIVNPPYGLLEKLLTVLPWLTECLTQGEGAGWRINQPEAEIDTELDEDPNAELPEISLDTWSPDDA
jgi:23S rRNA (adenine2030-N6)-methyltransferase